MNYPTPLPEGLRDFMNWRVTWPESDPPARLADAAVADLRHALGQAEAAYTDVVAEHENELALRLEAEAELAALKARRCETCSKWTPTSWPGSDRVGAGICELGITDDCGAETTEDDFACNHWAERQP